jgi:protein-S-isoprenylcysteine O-methyltransferase Ste14
MFGHFKLNLAASSVNTTDDLDIQELGTVGEWKNNEAQVQGDVQQDTEWAGAMHAFLMCGTFIVIFPLGVVFLRLLDRVKWHGWMQTVGLGFLLAGLGMGIWAGTMYNQVSYNSYPLFVERMLMKSRAKK